MEPMKPMKPMEPMKPMAPMKPQEAWWPKDLGEPSSTGSQNDTRYAYFPDKSRLVVDTGGGKVHTYDTGGQKISGFGQQQGGGSDMSFQTDGGSVDLKSLKQVD